MLLGLCVLFWLTRDAMRDTSNRPPCAPSFIAAFFLFLRAHQQTVSYGGSGPVGLPKTRSGACSSRVGGRCCEAAGDLRGGFVVESR